MIKIRQFVFYFLLVHVRFQCTSHPSMAKILLKWTAMLIRDAKQRRNMAASSQWSRIAPLMTFKNKFRSAQPHGKSGDMHWKRDVISWKQKIQRKTWDVNANRQCVYHNQSQYSKCMELEWSQRISLQIPKTPNVSRRSMVNLVFY